ncbi:MAG: sugar ABC transporter permease [Chloroflexi bacterium]|nr:sugar ABC transporter permease [Chloroflexota bacterium]
MRVKSETILPYSLLAPTLLFIVLLIVVPIFQAFLLAFQTADGDFTSANFLKMVTDTNFADALKFTLLLMVFIVPAQVVLALVMALLIHTRFKGHTFFLYIYAIPLAISDLAAGIAWLSIFTERGFLNSILYQTGVIDRPFLFLSYQNLPAMFGTIVVAESWRATAIVMVILLAGLQVIPRDYFEAADVFGATTLKRIFFVVLPLLRPSLQNALIIRTIFAFQTFSVVLALAGRVIPVLAGESYEWYANSRNANVASAYGVLILTFTVAATFVYFRLLRTSAAEAGFD